MRVISSLSQSASSRLNALDLKISVYRKDVKTEYSPSNALLSIGSIGREIFNVVGGLGDSGDHGKSFLSFFSERNFSDVLLNVTQYWNHRAAVKLQCSLQNV